MSAKKRIITCAISGASHTPAMSPHLPFTIKEMVRQSVEAAKAGASVIHLHAREPEDGRPSADPGRFREYVTGIKDECDAVVSLTTGGATGQTIEERLNNVVFMKRTADRLLGNDLEWSVLGSGRYQMNVTTVGAIMGSHVRVGLEDSLYLQKGRLAASNAEQVSKIRRILEELSIEVANAAETRQMLGLKGLDNVGF